MTGQPAAAEEVHDETATPASGGYDFGKPEGNRRSRRECKSFAMLFISYSTMLTACGVRLRLSGRKHGQLHER